MKSSLRFLLSISKGIGNTPLHSILSPEAEVTVLITLSFFVLCPNGNNCLNLAVILQQISASVSYSALILCPLIFTETSGLLDLFFIEELSFCMVLFINSLYTMDISLIEWQLLWWDPVGVLLDLRCSLNQSDLQAPGQFWQSRWGV